MVDEPARSEAVDFRTQIQALRSIVSQWGDQVRTRQEEDPAAAAREIGLSRRGQGPPSVVVGDDVGAELGRPGAASHALVLSTSTADLVSDGAVRCLGPDLDQAAPGSNLPFGQVVVLAHPVGQPPDPFEVQSTQYLANRLPGYMTRTVPGRLWVRVSKQALQSGFRLETLGRGLLAAYRMDFPQVLKAEVILATDRLVDLDSVAAEAKVLSGQHRKLVMVESGVYECDDLDCDSCDEQEVCDSLKDVTVKYRKRSTS